MVRNDGEALRHEITVRDECLSVLGTEVQVGNETCPPLRGGSAFDFVSKRWQETRDDGVRSKNIATSIFDGAEIGHCLAKIANGLTARTRGGDGGGLRDEIDFSGSSDTNEGVNHHRLREGFFALVVDGAVCDG